MFLLAVLPDSTKGEAGGPDGLEVGRIGHCREIWYKEDLLPGW